MKKDDSSFRSLAGLAGREDGNYVSKLMTSRNEVFPGNFKSMSEGLYLFCVARLSRLPTLPPMGQGLEDQSLLQVTSFQDLAAVWSPVPVEDFSRSEAQKWLGDLIWIGPRVIRHQKVITGVMRHSPVLPARFGTIFSSADSLERILQSHHDPIAGFLERVADQEEWAVKGLWDRSRAKEKLFSLKLIEAAPHLEGLKPGERYFQEQRLRAVCDLELPRWLREVCPELWTGLRDYAAEVRERRLLSREASSGNKDMVLNWAFLLPNRAVPGFKARIGEAKAHYADWGLELESTGPWPPYSFTPTLESEA